MEITKDSLPTLIRDFFNKIPDSGIKSISSARRRSVVVDNLYTSVKETELFEAIRSNPLLVPRLPLNANNELIDCDDYALQLKASITALYRQKMLVTNISIFPPAVGIVITQNHALNIAICESEGGGPEVFIIDPSESSPILMNDPKVSAKALKILPVNMIYI